MKKSNKYYKSFLYIIQKKLSVEDNKVLKDYAVQGCYLYIIVDGLDKNRFLFISPKHYEEGAKIYPETFRLRKVSGKKDAILLKKYQGTFEKEFFDVVEEQGDISIFLNEFIDSKNAQGKIFQKYKTHTKKIAIDYPDWYIDVIRNSKTKSYRKKFERDILCGNSYSPDIYEHFVSTLFIFKNRNYQRLNDHFIMLDEGKTGKSSLISFLSEKADNISVAGLYGSSDGKAGRFRGGLVTLTDKTIILDEINELVESKQKGEKILSLLNTILENGEYNYVKQFSAKIESSNQFGFMGNVSETFNFPIFLEGVAGNTLTIGRRIGVLTYSNDLGGFQKGANRLPKPTPYCRAIQMYLSNMFNYIIYDTKYLSKLFTHKSFIKYSKYYKQKLYVIRNNLEEEITRAFITSHAESIDRLLTRALKLFIYENMNKFISQEWDTYTNHLPFQVYERVHDLIEKNLIAFENIKEHIENSPNVSRKEEYNKLSYENLNSKAYKKVIELYHLNKDAITNRGLKYSDLEGDKKEIKFIMSDYKLGKNNPVRINELLLKYGCKIILKNNEVLFMFLNKSLFESKTQGLFENILEEVNLDEDLN